MRHALVPFAVVLAACGGSGGPAVPELPAFELRPVVTPAIAALERELGPLGPPAVADEAGVRAEVQGLVAFLQDSRGALRDTAFEDARALGDAATGVLREIALDPAAPEGDRAVALELLGHLDTPWSAEILLGLVRSAAEPWIRAHAAWRLGAGSQDQVVPHLILRLKYETDHETVLWLGDTLARLGNYSGLAGMVEVAGGGPPEIREAAAARMRKLAYDMGVVGVLEVQGAWERGDPKGDLPAPERSQRYDLEVWRVIDQLDDFQLRGVDDGRFVLERLDRHAAAILARALHDESVYVRVHAAQSLERMGPRARVAGPELVLALGEPELAQNAAVALGRIGHLEAVAPLTDLTAPAVEHGLRLAAVRGLGFLRFAGAADALRPLLAADEPLEIRQAAAEGLVYAGFPEEALELLCELLSEGKAETGSIDRALGQWFLNVAAATNDMDLISGWRRLLPPQGRIASLEEEEALRLARVDYVRATMELLGIGKDE